ncbi:MAG: signal recognition particle-docking protein FtsY [Acidimicrobiia bacterium]
MEPLVIVALIIVVIVVALVVIRARSRRSSPVETQPATRGEPHLSKRLSRTRMAIGGVLGSMFRGGPGRIQWDTLEEALILADVGPQTASDIVEAVRRIGPATSEEAATALRGVLVDRFGYRNRALDLVRRPAVIIVVGVNGAGKTTTIAKIADNLIADGRTVVLGAADTYRAAGDSQLKVWGDRLGVAVVAGAPGSDPASVAYAAIDHAKEHGTDVVIIDTAGRLHAHTNLMDELAKITRVAAREGGAIDEVLLVLDGSAGQNGIAQAKAFTEAVGVTGVVLTKLDGTPKGGVAVAVEHDLDLPIKYIGVGEGLDDLIPFEPAAFTDALVGP